MSVDCPHCGVSTELLLAPVTEEPTIPRRTILWTGITVLILLFGLAGSWVTLKRAERKVAANQAVAHAGPESNVPPAAPEEQPLAAGSEGFAASEINLLKAAGSSVVYATGTLTNATTRQRFGVKIVVELFDGAGRKLGETTDYAKVLEPNAVWNFRALVLDSKVRTGKVSAIHEE